MWPIDRPPQWVDRSGELATVRAGVEALRHGGGAAVWVEGEPGIGKLSLVVEALAGASELGWNIGWGIADQLAERLPLSVMQDCLGVRLASPDPRRALLLRSQRLGLFTDGDASVSGVEVLLALADELCAAAPTVMVIDDLQWADEASLLVWHQLAASIDQLRLLLIATCRSDPRRAEVQQVRASLARRGGALVTLGPLPEADVAALVDGHARRAGEGYAAPADRFRRPAIPCTCASWSTPWPATVQSAPFGPYRLQVVRDSFSSFESRIEIRSVFPTEYVVNLSIASVSSAVNVTAETTLLDPDSAGTSNHLDQEDITERPTSLPGRSLQDLVNSQPGWLYEGNAVLHPRGSEYQTQFVVDGIPLTDNRSPSFGPEIEADDVDSLTVYTAGIPAEYGRSLGGIIEVNTLRDRMSGLHGQAVVSVEASTPPALSPSIQYGRGHSTGSGSAHPVPAPLTISTRSCRKTSPTGAPPATLRSPLPATLQPRQRRRQVRRDGRLADASLAAGDRDDMARALQAHASGLLAEFGLEPAHPQVDLLNAELVGERVMNRGGQLLHHLVALGRLAQRDREAPLGNRRHVLDHSERENIGRVAGVAHPAQSLEHRLDW